MPSWESFSPQSQQEHKEINPELLHFYLQPRVAFVINKLYVQPEVMNQYGFVNFVPWRESLFPTEPLSIPKQSNQAEYIQMKQKEGPY